ncbi:hypothetical protein [Streptomyces beigongshangae]|uniref:hypothetical protein n=1 Tax=Streptomyces beigongshangae TaxID=2841597 RepID=UPI001C8543B6|nr:hypothetical protein [Streptomyces sp. REN17]
MPTPTTSSAPSAKAGTGVRHVLLHADSDTIRALIESSMEFADGVVPTGEGVRTSGPVPSSAGSPDFVPQRG